MRKNILFGKIHSTLDTKNSTQKVLPLLLHNFHRYPFIPSQFLRSNQWQEKRAINQASPFDVLGRQRQAISCQSG
jgi:hypothetical protein